MSFQRVAVIGGGLMGSGIAEVCIRNGCDTVVVEADADAAERARQRLDTSLARAVKAGKLDEAARDAALSALSVTTDLDAVSDRELVIEAIVELEQPKLELFERLDKTLADRSAIIASNTSSIPIMKLAVATTRPTQIVGMHFFNPAPVMNLVEVVQALLTSAETVDRVSGFVANVLKKKPIHSKDRAGFIVNALLVPYLLSAIRMLESGFASREDIDTGMVEGCAHPMGPLTLSDLVGLDTLKAVADSLYGEFREQHYAPPPLLCRMVEAGLLGRKSGHGFYDYAK